MVIISVWRGFAGCWGETFSISLSQTPISIESSSGFFFVNRCSSSIPLSVLVNVNVSGNVNSVLIVNGSQVEMSSKSRHLQHVFTHVSV